MPVGNCILTHYLEILLLYSTVDKIEYQVPLNDDVWRGGLHCPLPSAKCQACLLCFVISVQKISLSLQLLKASLPHLTANRFAVSRRQLKPWLSLAPNENRFSKC